MSNFNENLRYLYNARGFTKQQQFADDIKVGRSTISRLLGKQKPTENHKAKISTYFKLEKASDLDLDPQEFVQFYPNSNLAFLHLRTIAKTITKCGEVVERYRGQYIIYNRQADGKGTIASFFVIKTNSREGVEVEFINPYRDSTGQITRYTYTGYMYPVDDFMYCFLEEKSTDYDVLTIIFHAARTPDIGPLRGLMAGMAVHDGDKFIGAHPIVLFKRRNEINDWHKLEGTEIGYLNEGRTPERVLKYLSEQEVVVKR